MCSGLSTLIRLALSFKGRSSAPPPRHEKGPLWPNFAPKILSTFVIGSSLSNGRGAGRRPPGARRARERLGNDKTQIQFNTACNETPVPPRKDGAASKSAGSAHTEPDPKHTPHTSKLQGDGGGEADRSSHKVPQLDMSWSPDVSCEVHR